MIKVFEVDVHVSTENAGMGAHRLNDKVRMWANQYNSGINSGMEITKTELTTHNYIRPTSGQWIKYVLVVHYTL